MRHPDLIEWESQLRDVFDHIDEYVELKYGDLYPLHPSRAKKGSTGNKKHDGLFRLGAAFSAGYGSEHGAGYVIKVEMITLSKIPTKVRTEIEEAVVTRLKEELAKTFPDQKLNVDRDGRVYKIHGDLNFS